MSKRFLFITPLTPKHLLTPLRELLFNQFLFALNNQSYPNWEAILIGDEEKTEGKIKYLKVQALSKEIKLIFAKEYILNLKEKPDYIIRIDDDDIINPFVLEKISGLEFDCYADNYHAFYDIVSGKISQQNRPWLANTVIHKYEHAMIEYGVDKTPLFLCDHSKSWHDYYKDKKVIFSSKKHPIYLRVLSPTSITAETNELKSYNLYLKGFGKWKRISLNPFARLVSDIEKSYIGLTGLNRKKNILTLIEYKWNSVFEKGGTNKRESSTK